MASNSTDYLRFSAYSLKELITRKLASETKFTDQVYEGSNLAILIDIVCYMYQCMLYNINNAAAESMWSDTQIYENINRLAKLVGYCPKGAAPCTAVFTNSESTPVNFDVTIPKYAAIDTKLTDENGKKIYYSTVEDIEVSKAVVPQLLLYNGIWKLYGTIFTATGKEYQTLQLEDLTSNDENKTYVSSSMINVYIKDAKTGQLKQWTRVDQGLFTDNNVTNGSKIYSKNDNIYNVRLNENKFYEITFGNGFTGSIPTRNSTIYVFYLDSNGPCGKIELGDVQDAKIRHDSGLFGIDSQMYNDMFGENDEDLDANFSKLKEEIKWQNIQSSSSGAIEEDVDDIRRNAPEWFKQGNRLVTASDWEYYVKNRFRDNILDAVCQNNWNYISTFYRWLYNLGLSQHNDPKYYLTKNKLIKYDYKWSDAADTNNVYLWIKMKNDADIYKNIIDKDVNGIKVITQEAVYLKPLNVQFMICAQDVDEIKYQIKTYDMSFDGNYIEITVDDNTLYANSDVFMRVQHIINDFFNESNFTIGASIDTNALTNKIFDIGTISRVRTIYKNNETGVERIFPGISLASWTSDYVDIGDDVDVTTTVKSLEPFQFPNFYTKNLTNYIKIIRKSIGSMNAVQY